MPGKNRNNFHKLRFINELRENMELNDSEIAKPLTQIKCTLDELNQIQDFLQSGKTLSATNTGKEREVLIRGCIGIINEVYRAKFRLEKIHESDIPDSLRNLRLYIHKIWEHIEFMGFEIKDYLNEPYNDGLPLEVLEFSPSTSISLPLVTEIVRPSIRMKSQEDPLRSILVQKGAVFVSIPASE